MDRFLIDKIWPTDHENLWGALIVINTPETINDIDIGQTASLKVRFFYPEGDSAAGLLEAATRKAEECLASATALLSGQSASNLHAAVLAERDALEAARKVNLTTSFDQIFPEAAK